MSCSVAVPVGLPEVTVHIEWSVSCIERLAGSASTGRHSSTHAGYGQRRSAAVVKAKIHYTSFPITSP